MLLKDLTRLYYSLMEGRIEVLTKFGDYFAAMN